MYTHNSDTYFNNGSKDLQNDIEIIPAWIQTRVSTKNQVGIKLHGLFEEKASLEEQAKKCKEAILNYKNRCPKCSKEIALEFVGISTAKGESGQNFEREDTNEFLKLAKENKFKVLITSENDRLARSRGTGYLIREQLKKKGIQIYSLAQPLQLKCPNCFDYYDDDTSTVIETISDMKSQLDLSRIRRNYKIGMRRRIEKGKPTGSLAYGLIKKYKVSGKDVVGNDILETAYEWDPIKVSVINSIVKDYLNCVGVWKICQNLNKVGIPSPQGKKWGRSAILVILKNPAYAGFTRWGWKPVKNGIRKIQPPDKWLIYKAQYKAIWNSDFYEKLQQEIKRRSKVGGRTVMSNSLLIGLLKCGYCGYSMFQTKTSKILKNGKTYLYKGYGCGAFLHAGSCRHNGKKQEVVDQIVLREVIKLANETSRRTFLEKVNKTKTSSQEDLYKLKAKEFERVQYKLRRIVEAYRDGIDTLGEYKRNKEELIPLRDNLEVVLKKLKSAVKIPAKMEWNNKYESILSKFLTYPTNEDRKTIRRILFRLVDKLEFKSNPLYIKIHYKVSTVAL